MFVPFGATWLTRKRIRHSPTNSPRATTDTFTIPSPTGYTRPQHLSPPLPLDAPAPARRLRQSSLQRRPVDIPDRLEPRPHHR